ncbi:MAG: ABC transporter ATP-binding protein [Kiritimatiellae bacterium]|nr:ABC transporter ATP-binding protein [Kiritimatiellia bacterium]
MSLIIDHVSKSFPNQNKTLPVLRDIHLEIQGGEFFCIAGPSGCGKTTLLNIIAGLEPADSGTTTWNGKRIDHIGPERLMIFQELGLFPWLTVLQNVEFGLKMKGISAKERRKTALVHLEMVHLAKFKDAYIHELSGGMKQRVALARALAMDPQVLLMDEPFTALDAQTRDMLHDELQRLWTTTKKTIIFVTHNIREAVCLGDRVAVLSARPGILKNIVSVSLPRPRRIEDHGLMEIVRVILEELKGEIEKTVRDEFHEDTVR